MKRTLALLLTTLVLLTLCAACGKKKNEETSTQPDPNAVLTDSAVPLEVGAEMIVEGTDPEVQEMQTVPIDEESPSTSATAPSTTREMRTERLEEFSDPEATLPAAQ